MRHSTDSTESQPLLTEMTWQEAETTFGETDLVILPCGATKQRSIHLLTSVGSIRTGNPAAELAAAAPEYGSDPLVLPALPYGYLEHHISYAGTISLGADTYQEVITDVDRSAQHRGRTRFLVADFYGGSTEPHKLALGRPQRDRGLDSYYAYWIDFTRDRLEARFGTEWDHVGKYETSVIEHCHSDLVRDDHRTPRMKKNRYEVRQYAHFDDPTVESGLGDPTQPGPEFPEGVIESTTDHILTYLQSELEQRRPRRWRGGETDRRTKSSEIANRDES